MKRAILIVLLGMSTLSIAAVKDSTQKQATQEKENYLNKADQKVQHITTQIESVQQRSEATGSQARQKFDTVIQTIKNAIAQIRQKMQALFDWALALWNRLREGLSRAPAVKK